MSAKKQFLFSLLIYIFVSFAFSQPVTVRQLSTLSVLGSKSESEIQFTVTEDEGDSKTITILPFSYKDKTVDQFSFSIKKKQDGSFYANNISVIANDGKQITILEAELIFNSEPELRIKYKPGKMPFPITLMKKEKK